MRKMIKIEIIAFDDEPTAKVIFTSNDLNTHLQYKIQLQMLGLLTNTRKRLVTQMISDPSNYWRAEGSYKVE